jgi:hypothetical protein
VALSQPLVCMCGSTTDLLGLYINIMNAGLINQIMETLMEHCGRMKAGGTMVEIQVRCNAVQSRESF